MSIWFSANGSLSNTDIKATLIDKMPSRISRIHSAAPFNGDIDGYSAHPIDEIEPLLDGRDYRQVCQDLLTSFNRSILAILTGDATAQSVGSLWGIATYRSTKPAEIDLEISLDRIRQADSIFKEAYFRLYPKVQQAIGFIADKANQQIAAMAVGFHYDLECCEGLSQEEAATKFGVCRAAMSTYVRGIQRAGGNKYTSNYQKSNEARQAFREARYRHLAEQQAAQM